jgi:ATP-dependent Zn protease
MPAATRRNARYSIAVHEAGHAVIAHVLGMLPQSATAVADHECGGHVIIPEPNAIQYAWDQRGIWRDFEWIVRRRILAYMAGREAAEELMGDHQMLDEDDRYWIVRMFWLLPMGDMNDAKMRKRARACEARMRKRARVLVRRHRLSIERVATALMEADIINGEQIAKLIASLPDAGNLTGSEMTPARRPSRKD